MGTLLPGDYTFEFWCWNQLVEAQPFTVPGDAYQIVYGIDGSSPAGDPVSIPVYYTTSDNNNTLMGLGVRIHYNTSELTFDGLSDVNDNGLPVIGEPESDDDDFDRDPSTDTFVHVAWIDIAGQWPNESLPKLLYVADFLILESLPDGATSTIRFSSSSTAAGYDLQFTPVTVTVRNYNWDIDGNDVADALTDGMLAIRYLFGFRGNTLCDGTVQPDATRTCPEMETYLDAMYAADYFDIDGNGEQDALTDGVLLIRYLFGFRGTSLCDGAVAPDATRDCSEIEAYIASYEKELDGKPELNRFYTEYDNPITPNASSYTLPLDLGLVENYSSMNATLDLQIATPLLEQSGFAIIDYKLGEPNDDIVEPYEKLRQMDVPIFITSDTLLHLYHVQFDETLKDIEEREFYSDIRDLTGQLLENALTLYGQYTADVKEAAKRNVAYLAVAQKLILPDAQVPERVADLVASEVAKIEAHSGFAASDIFVYEEDYSQYAPRGHYTRSEELERYFKTLMWYGRMAFLLKGSENWGPAGEALISVYDARIQTMQAVLLAQAIEHVQVGPRSGCDVWERIYAITAFYVGLADDLTPYEYVEAVEKVFGSSFEPSDLENEDKFLALKTELALLPSPEIFGGTGNAMVSPPVTAETLNELLDKTKGMRFMGQRFIPDSYMFQHLVFPEVLDYTGHSDPKPFTYGSTGVRGARCYPRGLDVMAVLGSDRAKTILIEEGDTDYVDYELRFNELKAEFDSLSLTDWNRNLYWGWLYSLQALLGQFPEGYPNFMRTQNWEKKELNAALASWTELRHDTILYAKPSYTPIETGLPPAVKGYVEPVPEFYGRLLALTRMTREGLADFGALSTQGEERLVNLENILSRLIEIANKELTNEVLTEDDYDYIRNFGSLLEGRVLGVDDKGVSTILVADVHTHAAEGTVVEEGVGYVELIVVACPLANGGAFLAAGPVLSYYEFKHPMNDRLTDEAWCELLASPERPERPAWFQSLLGDTVLRPAAQS